MTWNWVQLERVLRRLRRLRRLRGLRRRGGHVGGDAPRPPLTGAGAGAGGRAGGRGRRGVFLQCRDGPGQIVEQGHLCMPHHTTGRGGSEPGGERGSKA